MSHPLPHRPSIDHTPAPLSVVDLSDDESTAVLDSLSSRTARSLLAVLDDGPATASDLTDRLETSLQNVRYHLDKLHAAGVVDDVGTWYSSKGREMRVYALTSERIAFRLGEADPSRFPVARGVGSAE